MALAAWVPKEIQQAKIAQLMLGRLVVGLCTCLDSPCVGREHPSFSRYLDAERTGINTSMVVLRGGKSDARWHRAGRGSGTALSSAPALPVHPATASAAASSSPTRPRSLNRSCVAVGRLEENINFWRKAGYGHLWRIRRF